jgi:hypothetical protein
MNHRTVPLSLVEDVTRQNTSADRHSQARDRLSRALFATQSATHFDHGWQRQAAGPGKRLQAPTGRSAKLPMSGWVEYENIDDPL